MASLHASLFPAGTWTFTVTRRPGDSTVDLTVHDQSGGYLVLHEIGPDTADELADLLSTEARQAREHAVYRVGAAD